MVDAGMSRFRDHGFRVEGHAETVFANHGEVVRAVADGKRFLGLQSQFSAQAEQRFELRLASENRFGDAAGELAAYEDEPVRLVRVEADRMRHALGEKGEAARDERAG